MLHHSQGEALFPCCAAGSLLVALHNWCLFRCAALTGLGAPPGNPLPPYRIPVPMLLGIKRSSCIHLQGQSFLKANQQVVEDVEPLRQCWSGNKAWLGSSVIFTCCSGLLQLSPERCSILYQADAE